MINQGPSIIQEKPENWKLGNKTHTSATKKWISRKKEIWIGQQVNFKNLLLISYGKMRGDFASTE